MSASGWFSTPSPGAFTPLDCSTEKEPRAAASFPLAQVSYGLLLLLPFLLPQSVAVVFLLLILQHAAPRLSGACGCNRFLLLLSPRARSPRLPAQFMRARSR